MEKLKLRKRKRKSLQVQAQLGGAEERILTPVLRLEIEVWCAALSTGFLSHKREQTRSTGIQMGLCAPPFCSEMIETMTPRIWNFPRISC